MRISVYQLVQHQSESPGGMSLCVRGSAAITSVTPRSYLFQGHFGDDQYNLSGFRPPIPHHSSESRLAGM